MGQENTNTPQTAQSQPSQASFVNGDSAMARKLRAPGKYYAFVVTYIVMLSALGSFMNDMYSPALPAMCKFFSCSVSTVQMGITMGMIGLALGQLVLGPLSDRYGRRPVLVASASLFIVSATVSIFSPTIEFFVTCRLFQGLGASGGYFLARTIPADVYTGRGLAKLMALTGAINGVAPASAPVIGGVTADAFGWKGIFVVLIIYAIIVLALSPMMKESLAPDARYKGLWWKAFKGYIVLLRNKPFQAHTIVKGLTLGLLFAYVSSAPFILETHYGLSQTVYGLVIGANSVFVALGSMVALKFRPLKKATHFGSIILGVAVGAQALALFYIHSIWVYEICAMAMLFAMGLIFTCSNTLAMNEGRERAGEASALLGVAGYIVGAIAAPCVGIGNLLHATAITFVVLTALIFIFAVISYRLAPDLK